MATKKLIDLHKEWCEKGMLPENGLCNSVPKKYRELLYDFEPNHNEEEDLAKLGMSWVYWGCEIPYDKLVDYETSRKYIYTPLRQTIVLLICAMKNEI